MVRKREDGRWEGRIVVGHKENGEPIFRYVLAKTQKELLAKLHRDMDIYQDAQLTEDSRMTLGEWLDRWMEEYGAVTLRPNTLRSYEQYIRCYSVVRKVEGIKLVLHLPPFLVPFCTHLSKNFFRIFFAANILLDIFWCLTFSCAAISFMVRPSTQ